MDEKEKYTAFTIPQRTAEPKKKEFVWEPTGEISFSGDGFAEIEYEHSPVGSVAGEKRSFTLVPASQLIGKRTVEPVRQKFQDMRGLATDNPFARDEAKLFYKQAKFMEDFTDDYTEYVGFSMYYPYYQYMTYEQLRTYFTWRTKARLGEIVQTSLSYVFVYIYELLSGIGVGSPSDGADKLMGFWRAYGAFDPALDKYLPKWLKDYHIYYDLPYSFQDFIQQNALRDYYPELFCFGAEADNCLVLWNGLSKYDITKSKFYTAGNEALMNDCFYAVLCKIQELCANQKQNSRFEDLLIYRINKGATWRPFEGALFYPWLEQPDRQTEVPGGEVFYCKNNRWTADIAIHYSGKKELIGYIIKKTEACLRQVVKYKHSIKAERDMLSNDVRRKLKEAGIPFSALKKLIEKTVDDFHKGLKPIIKVEVDHANLARIRHEAMGTQSKLIVPEDEAAVLPAVTAPEINPPPLPEQSGLAVSPVASDDWSSFRETLSDTEIKALQIALSGGDIKSFAAENSVMPEVLADAINEKAMDHIGDNILELDGDTVIYEEYAEKIRGMVG